MVATCSPVEVAPRGLIHVHRGDRVAEKQVRAKVGGTDGHEAKAGDGRRRQFAANRKTSHRAAEHRWGRWPERSSIQRERPSTAPNPMKEPAIVLSR